MALATGKIGSMDIRVERLSLSHDEKELDISIYAEDDPYRSHWSPFNHGVHVRFSFKGTIKRISTVCTASHVRFSVDHKSTYSQDTAELVSIIQNLIVEVMKTPEFEGYLYHTGRLKHKPRI